MGSFSSTRWVSLSLLCIVIPLTLLVTSRLTGLRPEPQTPQTIVREPVSWNMTRPTIYPKYSIINETVQNVHDDETSFIGFAARISTYHENSPDTPFDWNDGLSLSIRVVANVSDGFVHSVVVRFSRTDDYAYITMFDDPDFVVLENLKFRGTNVFGDAQREAFVEAVAVGKPENCLLKTVIFWCFRDENNVEHRLTITAEVTYFDGSTWQKVILPIKIGVLID